MKKTLHYFKDITPTFIWNSIRKSYYFSIKVINSIGPYIRVMDYCGIKLYYNKGNGLIMRLKKENIFEKEMSESIVSELIKVDNPIFVDIGANIGLISFFVNSKIKDLNIHAFEPGLNQRKLLSTTVKNNSLKNIEVHSEALGDKIGSVTFYAHEAKDAALDGLKDTQRRGNTKAIEVSMITLDSWWISENKPKISVMKIDTEGAELLVLRGAEQLIIESRPTVFIEIEPQNLKAYPYSESDIFNYFKDIKYSINPLNKDTYIGRPLI